MEPDIFLMYTSASPKDKRMVRLMLELLGVYILVLSVQFFTNEYYVGFISSMFVLLTVVLVCEGVSFIMSIVRNWCRFISAKINSFLNQ